MYLPDGPVGYSIDCSDDFGEPSNMGYCYQWASELLRWMNPVELSIRAQMYKDNAQSVPLAVVESMLSRVRVCFPTPAAEVAGAPVPLCKGESIRVLSYR